MVRLKYIQIKLLTVRIRENAFLLFTQRDPRIRFSAFPSFFIIDLSALCMRRVYIILHESTWAKHLNKDVVTYLLNPAFCMTYSEWIVLSPIKLWIRTESYRNPGKVTQQDKLTIVTVEIFKFHPEKLGKFEDSSRKIRFFVSYTTTQLYLWSIKSSNILIDNL